MKKFALLFIALLAISCSDDDTNSNAGTDLKTMVTSLYGAEGTLLDRAVMDFEDNKPSKYTIYHPSGEIYRTHDYLYWPDGQLKTMKLYNSGQLAVTLEYEYDSQHRLVKMTHTDHLEFDDIMGNDYSYDYVHNADNTITKVSDTGQQDVFYMNGSGQVYKIVYHSGIVSEVEYSGNDVLEYSHGNGVIMTYFYDDVHPVKGEYLNMFKNQFRGYEANHILHGSLQEAVTASGRYIIHQVQNNGNTTDYNYEFNDAGYPVRIASSQNGEEPHVFVDITYQ